MPLSIATIPEEERRSLMFRFAGVAIVFTMLAYRADCVPSARKITLEDLARAWDAHVQLRESIQYEYTAEYFAPPTQRPAPRRILDAEHHNEIGRVAIRKGVRLQERETWFSEDGKKARDHAVFSANGSTTVFDRAGGKAIRFQDTPHSSDFMTHSEEDMINLGGAEPFRNTFAEPLGIGKDGVKKSLLVRTDEAGLACPVLLREWSISDPTSPTLTFDCRVEIWFDPERGLLPTKIESGKAERGGRMPATAQLRTFELSEIRQKVFLITGYEAEHGGWVGNIRDYVRSPEYLTRSGHPTGRFRVRMENVRLGDEVATPTLTIPPGVKVREARRNR